MSIFKNLLKIGLGFIPGVGPLIAGAVDLIPDGKAKKQAEFDRLSNIPVMQRTTDDINKLNALRDKGFSKTIDKPSTTDKPAGNSGKTGLFSKIGEFFVKGGKPTVGGWIGLGLAVAGGIFAIFKSKAKRKKEALAKQAEMDKQQTLNNPTNKIDQPQTFNRSMGYDPFAGRQDYFNSPFVNQSGPTNQFAGFNRGYQGAYPPPPRVNPFATRPMYGRPAVNPRMAQFNPNATFRPFA